MAEFTDCGDVWRMAVREPIGSGLSDSRLLSLGRIHLALHSIAANGLSDDFGMGDSEIMSRIDAIFAECCRRCRGCSDFERLCLLAPALYELAQPELAFADDGKLMECHAVADRLTDMWLGDGLRQDSPGVMRAVIEYTCNLAAEERESFGFFQKYKSVVAGWCSTLSESRAWAGVSNRDALARIGIIVLNSVLLSDSSYDHIITDVYNIYKVKVLENNGGITAGCLLGLLDVEKYVGMPDGDDGLTADGIRKAALKGIECNSPDGDEFWRYLSAFADCCCLMQYQEEMP